MIVLISIALRPPAKAESEIVFLEAEPVLKEPNRLQRWVEALRSKLVRPQAVIISAEIVSSDRLTAELIGRKPLAQKEGMQVWILKDDELLRISDSLRISRRNLIANPRMMMNEGEPRSTFIGSSAQVGANNVPVGFTMRMKALRGETNTDLFLSVMETEVMTGSNKVAGVAVRTNIYVGARVQLPAQHVSRLRSGLKGRR